MDKFGHFFEFFAALNSAYIVSNLFLRAIATKINQHFTNLKNEVNSVLRNQTETETLLFQEIKNANASISTNNTIPAIGRLNKKAREIRTNITTFQASLSTSEKSCSISANFNFLCLFSSLYCISILILNGFDFKFDTPYNREGFLLYNLFSVGILVWMMWKKNRRIFKNRKLSYIKVLNIFFLSLLILPVFYVLELLFPKIDCKVDFGLLNVIISLIIPVMHFFYYFVISTIRTKRECKKLIPLLNTIKSDHETFVTEMNTTFTTLRDVQIIK